MSIERNNPVKLSELYSGEAFLLGDQLYVLAYDPSLVEGKESPLTVWKIIHGTLDTGPWWFAQDTEVRPVALTYKR